MIGALILTLVAFVCLFLKTSQKLRNWPNSRYSKYSSYSRIVKFGRKCEIWSTPISLVWKGLTEFITIGQTQTFSMIAIRGCSLNISKNHSLPLGLLSKCICHRHGLCLCCCLFVGSSHVLLSLSSNVSKIALWRRSLNVFVIVFVFAVVFLLVRSCFLITQTKSKVSKCKYVLIHHEPLAPCQWPTGLAVRGDLAL